MFSHWKHWWDRWPGRLEAELHDLVQRGIAAVQDEEAFRLGVLKLRLIVPIEDGKLNLTAWFPPSYPYFRPEVFADDLDLLCHQNPFEKNLCLLPRGTEHWDPDWTLAELLERQLPLLLKVIRERQSGVTPTMEEPQGEPFSAYYQYHPAAMLLVDSAWSIPYEECYGELEVALERGVLTQSTNEPPVIRGVVTSVASRDGRKIAAFDPIVAELYPERIPARWVRLSAPLRERDPDRMHHLLSKEFPQVFNRKWPERSGWRLEIVGVLFPEELQQGKTGDGFLFLVRTRSPGKRNLRTDSYLARAGRYGRSDLAGRVPEITAVAQKKIAVVGLGGLGGPTALQLAQAGVGELRFVDHDFVDPGTAVRWAVGLPAVGHLKAPLIGSVVRQNWPYTRVRWFIHRFGGAMSQP